MPNYVSPLEKSGKDESKKKPRCKTAKPKKAAAIPVAAGPRSLRDRTANKSLNETKLSLDTLKAKAVPITPKKKIEEPMQIDQIQNPEEIDPAKPYDKITIEYKNDEDIQCDICLEFEYEDDD